MCCTTLQPGPYLTNSGYRYDTPVLRHPVVMSLNEWMVLIRVDYADQTRPPSDAYRQRASERQTDRQTDADSRSGPAFRSCSAAGSVSAFIMKSRAGSINTRSLAHSLTGSVKI
eukprot:GHVU01126483.1.p1 GENE.GHVU01126483.1~~GHVU01126483.1.p1  ORF type:complete len:114 (+),score=1.35 GHVU01126483.1:20-361(+)